MLLNLIQDFDLFWYCFGTSLVVIAAMFFLAHLENKKFKD